MVTRANNHEQRHIRPLGSHDDTPKTAGQGETAAAKRFGQRLADRSTQSVCSALAQGNAAAGNDTVDQLELGLANSRESETNQSGPTE